MVLSAIIDVQLRNVLETRALASAAKTTWEYTKKRMLACLKNLWCFNLVYGSLLEAKAKS